MVEHAIAARLKSRDYRIVPRSIRGGPSFVSFFPGTSGRVIAACRRWGSAEEWGVFLRRVTEAICECSGCGLRAFPGRFLFALRERS